MKRKEIITRIITHLAVWIILLSATSFFEIAQNKAQAEYEAALAIEQMELDGSQAYAAHHEIAQQRYDTAAYIFRTILIGYAAAATYDIAHHIPSETNKEK